MLCIIYHYQGVISISEPIRQTTSAEAQTIDLPIPETKLFKKSVYYYGTTLWNLLLTTVRKWEDMDSFKLEIIKLNMD